MINEQQFKTDKLRAIERLKHDKLRAIERNCHKCGRKLYWLDFMFPHSDYARIRIKKDYGRVLMEEIWTNPVFVLECCWCFAGIPFLTMVEL